MAGQPLEGRSNGVSRPRRAGVDDPIHEVGDDRGIRSGALVGLRLSDRPSPSLRVRMSPGPTRPMRTPNGLSSSRSASDTPSSANLAAL